ncbi:Calx-beta domain-containing protein [Maribacter sp. TH_r10]|uniref:beta strand repeat-containing protein n=1 Tax=Maribacter sp. TH_r10 TaxID=3082086 RepID=UPI0029555A68|nr:Calx-beta domain-containing protein [Maribacter sp. TH_r10]MDV7140983.1 Calx-beta domain-containing protein [Maribacter sp. TH_r10]
MMEIKVPGFYIVLIFLFLGVGVQAQATITIEVNWPNWSSENRVTFRDPSNTQIGGRICNPAACYNGSGNNSYNNIGSPQTYTGIPYGTNYDIYLQDRYGDGWNGGGSYVRVYQDGVLILSSDLTSGSTRTVSFDIIATAPALSIGDVSVNEDDGTATFTVTHIGANASGPFTANYETVDGTALAGSDYTTNIGTLNFNGTAGDTETITVSILDDGAFENPETFTIQFTGVSDTAVDISDTGVGTINDDDVLIMNDGVTENTCSDVFLDPGGTSNYGNNLDVVYTICADTANNYISVDFTSFDVRSGDLLYVYDGNSTGGTLIGQYDNNNIPDFIDSTNGTNCLTFRFVSNGGTNGEGWQADVSCHPEGPKIEINDISFDEDVGVAIFTVTQTRAPHGFTFFGFFVNRPFTVDFQTADGTALAGSDYTATSGTITFNGEVGNVQTISVPITNDGVSEFDEDFTIEFTDAIAQYATVNYSDTGTGTINSQISANVPLTLFQEFDGYYDYSTTGGTLRTESNAGDFCAITSSSSNTLVSSIPATATIDKAYLYWAHSSTVVDGVVTFEGQTVNANYQYQTTLTNRNFYGYVSDVTSIVQGIADPSSNTYDFSGLTIDNTGNYCSTATVLGGWALFVFYEDPSLPAVNINLYQGFDGLSNAGTSFTLDSFYAIAGSGAKASFLSWEGDPNLDGSSSGSTNPEELSITNQSAVTNILSGDGGQPGNNAYNSTIYDNTVTPVYNTATSYGVDLDTYDISTFISPGDTQVTANVDVGQDFVISNAVILKVPSNLVAGMVFEDVNYPGGAGRNRLASSGLAVQGATVEIFDSSGNFVQRTTTDLNGRYSFGGIPDGTYSIKVVNSTVRSNRGGGLNCSACYPVQTFRSYESSSTIIGVTNEVGGANPSAFQDVALGVLTGAQSVSSVSLAGNGIVGIDFGFNFNTIVNTNDIGQGSLNQFILNSNTLGETGLDIEANGIFDPAAGEDTSVFMIPPPSDPLGRTADANYSSGYFDIDIPNGSPLPVITDNDTHIDGRTQTAYSGNSNAGTVGSGGTTVGISATVLPSYDRPEIQVHRIGGDVLVTQGSNTIIRNISVYADNNAAIRVDGGSATISNNLLGVNALGSNAGNVDYGVEITDGTMLVDGNYIATNTDAGIFIDGGTSSTIQNNQITANGDAACDDNITIGNGSGIVIQQNLIENAASLGIDGDGIAGDVLITENTVTSSGQDGGNCGGNVANAGIRLDGSNSTISNNIIASNGGPGLVLAGGNTSGNLISQNSFYGNGTASDALGIDLDASDAIGDGVTLNDNSDADAGPNGAMNFPVISLSNITGTSIVIEGWARPGAIIEFFLTDINEGNAVLGDNQLGMTTDYGEGQTYIATVVEGSGTDLDSGTSSYTDLDGNTDTTNKFKFSIPLPSGVAKGEYISATATVGNSTSEFSPFSILKVYTVITNRRITYRVNPN